MFGAGQAAVPLFCLAGDEKVLAYFANLRY